MYGPIEYDYPGKLYLLTESSLSLIFEMLFGRMNGLIDKQE